MIKFIVRVAKFEFGPELRFRSGIRGVGLGERTHWRRLVVINLLMPKMAHSYIIP